MKKIKLKIDGMQCGMCEAHINEAIRKAFPVKKVTSSHSKGETVILTEQDLSEEQLRNVLESMDYDLLSMSVKDVDKKSLLDLIKK